MLNITVPVVPTNPKLETFYQKEAHRVVKDAEFQWIVNGNPPFSEPLIALLTEHFSQTLALYKMAGEVREKLLECIFQLEDDLRRRKA